MSGPSRPPIFKDFYWVELVVRDPKNLKKRTKLWFPLLLPHELLHYLNVPRL